MAHVAMLTLLVFHPPLIQVETDGSAPQALVRSAATNDSPSPAVVDSGDLDGSVELARGLDCFSECVPDVCPWTETVSAIAAGNCDATFAADPILARLCRLGIVLDGDISDALPSVLCPASCESCPCDRLEACYPKEFPGIGGLRSDRGVYLIDRVFDFQDFSVDPGICGDAEQPVNGGRPSGFNVGRSILWFVPDEIASEGDTSFLYIAWDIAEFGTSEFQFGNPHPFDADGNGHAIVTSGRNDVGDEEYRATFQTCANLFAFTTVDPSTNMVRPLEGSEPVFDTRAILRIAQRKFGGQFGELLDPDNGNQRLLAFPTLGNGEVCGAPGNSHSCIEELVRHCARFSQRDSYCAGSMTGDTTIECPDEACDPGFRCISNNVEMVLTAVETSGLFGPHAIAAPGSPEAKQNRIALSRLVAVLTAGSNTDEANEEVALVAQAQSLPDLEVFKSVRCAEEGDTTFDQGPADALPGSLVQYEITIENTGNDDVDVHVRDVLESIGDTLANNRCQAYCGNTCSYPDPNCAGVNCPGLPWPAGTPVANQIEKACASNADCAPGGTCTGSPLTARLNSQRRGNVPTSTPLNLFITNANANLEPICPNDDPQLNPPGCLVPGFFSPLCTTPGSFLESLSSNADIRMGTLLGALATRQFCGITGTPCETDSDCAAVPNGANHCGPIEQTCQFVAGDSITLRFFVRAGEAPGEPYCDTRAPIDCVNTVTVTASLPGADDDDRLSVCDDTGLECDDEFPCLPGGTCVPLERSDEADLDILCREIDFTKEIGCEGIEESFVTFPDSLAVPGDCAGLSCCSPHPSTPGCSDATCQANVCAQRPECCSTGWDETCVSLAQSLCAICGNPNTCCEPDARPGCNNDACESAVCSIIPSCCSGAWDETCVAQARKSCDECSETFCCVAHDTPDCPSDTCSDRVCAFYPECCADAWGDNCALAALDGCEPCGGGYSCCEARAFIPGCEDAACQALVCADDPFCCGNDPDFGGVWDQNCVDLATIVCQTCALTGADRTARAVAGGSQRENADGMNQAAPAAPGRTRDPAERLAIARAGSDTPGRLAVSRIETGVAGITFDPVTIEYRYRVINTGETPETLSICDREFCCDVDAIARQLPGQIELLNCDVCRSCDACADCEDCDPSQGPCPDCEVCSRCLSSTQPVSPAGRCRANPTIACVSNAQCPVGDSCSDGALAAACAIRFHTEEALRAFTLRDDADDVCVSGVPPIVGAQDENCYRNCATATADIGDDDALLGDFCRPPTPEISVNALAEYCIVVCNLRVFKQVRCLPDCDPAALGAEAGWNNRCVANPSLPCDADADCPLGDSCDTAAEPALPGACLQYRIIIDNPPTAPGAEPAPICALNVADTMTAKDTFSAGPYDVRVTGAACDNLASEFNWDGEPVCCSFASDSFAPGERVVVTFRADVAMDASPAAAPINRVDIEGASDGHCAEVCAQSRFSCDAFADVPIDVRDCAFTLEKEVRCDTADGSGSYAEKEEALPGSTAEFRFEVCNTGDVDLTGVALDDEMMASCEGWFIPGSVVCAIAGQPATSCVCLDGSCDTADEIDGLKNLAACRAGGIRATVAPPTADECLVCTFKVRVPADYAEKGTDCLLPNGSDCDCVNTITAEPASDVCHDERGGAVNPCDRLVDDARLDVRVPQIECDKESCVDLDRNGTCDITVDAGDPEEPLCVPAADAVYPLRVIWTFEAIAPDPGEAPFAVARVCDKDFRDHAALNAGAGVPANERVTIVSCDLDAVTGCATVGRLEPGQTKLARCTLEFPSEAAWRRFAAKENSLDKFCYTNEARASGDIDTAGLCSLGADLTKESDACVHDTCIEPLCEIDVVKQARCLPDCSPTGLGPNDGWRNACRNNPAVPCDKNADCPAGDTCNTDPLPVPAGSCVQYRIVFKNKSVDVPLRGIRVTDTMSNKDRFKPDPLSSTTTCPCTFVPAFNIDGTPSTCQFTEQTELQPGASCSITFTREVREAGDALLLSQPDPVNSVLAEGAPGLERCEISPKSFECNDNSQVTVDVQRCDFTVTKDAKCEEEPDASFRDKADALPGSRVDFRIRVCNTGDITLPSLTLSDAFADSARCDWYVAESLTAFIGQTNVTGAVCNTPGGNANQCQTVAEMNGTKTFAGGLAPAACLEIRFKVRVPADFDEADDAATNCSGNGCPTGCDCCNNVTVSTTPGFCPDGRQGQIPPCPTRTDCACVDVKVPEIECDKASCIDLDADGDCDITVPAGANPDLCVPAADAEYPLEVIWFFRARNTGEVPYAQTRVCDPDFVADLNANANNPDIILMGCDLSLTTGCAELGALPANPALLPEAKCVVRFLSEAGWRDFAAKDTDGDEFCYTNEAEAIGTVNTAGLCTTGADLTIESEPCEHITCIEPLCEIGVVKQARCLPNCTATGLGLNEGWRNACVNNPATPCESNADCPQGDTCNLGPLPVAAGACIQYRIVIRNPSTDVPIRALRVTDTLTGANQFASGPSSVVNTCNCTLAPPFNDIGTPSTCQPVSGDVLAPGATCFISYIRELRERTDPLLNFAVSPNDGVVVEGAPGLDVCPVSPKSFKCENPGNVGVDIQSCQFAVTKDAKCEEDPDAAFANQVEALPGSRVDFRIRVCNQGDLPLTSVNLSDEITCLPWFISESVTATINAVNVTSAICNNNSGGAANQCQTLSEMNGNKTLPGAGVPSGQCLEIRFKVRVPVDFAQKGTDCLLPDGSDCDCVNTIAVRPGTVICTDARTGQPAPCDQLNDTARIDVRVPQIECDKSSCIDLPPADGVCDIPVGGDPATVCATSGEIAYPFNLRLTLEAVNPPAGEVDYSTVRVCDPDLRNDLPPVNPIPGVTVNGCVFDANGCIALAPLVSGGTASITCVITFQNEDAWRTFAARDTDGEAFCYENTARAVGDIDADDLCTSGATLTRTSEPCEHTTCIEPQCDIGVVKQARCLPNCSEAGLGANEGWKSNVCSGNRARACESNADCAGAGTCVTDLDVTAGACVQYRIVVTNESDDVPIRALRFTDLLTNRDTFKPTALSATNTCSCTFDVPFNIDGNPSICQLPPGNRLEPGESCEVKFIREVRERSDAQLNFALDPSNAVTVEGASGVQECPISPKAFTCEDDSAVHVNIRRCDFTVEKQVKCAEEPDTAYADVGYALPGSCNDFRVRIRNTGEVPLDEVTVTDALSCDSWYVFESLSARLNGAGQDLTAVFCASNAPGTTPGKCQAAHEMNGRKALVPAQPNGLAPGDFIDIVFRVCVPVNFAATGTAVDCTNTVEVGGETAICEDERTSAESACGTHEDSAGIDVRVPKVECDKEACFDFNADGSCEIDFSPLTEVDECAFPMDVIWRFRARNIGETGLTNVLLSDADFWNDATNLGIAYSCDAGAPGPGGVFTIPSLAAGAESAYITCTLSFPDEAVWRAFSDGDGDSNGVQDCRTNTITVTGEPSGDGLVDGSGAPINLCDSAILATSTCQASACCGACEIVEECPPVVKAFFEVFNENEAKLSGMERCVQSWDSRFFSKYTDDLFVPNYFYMWLLGTDKGVARIDGIASPQVCGPDSVAAPLVGVATKRIAWDTVLGPVASRAGMTLVSAGFQAGQILYPVRDGDNGDDDEVAGTDPRGGGGPKDNRPGTPATKLPGSGSGDGGDDGEPDPSRGLANDPLRATISEKGSFLVFPKVEVKYDRRGKLAADTFVSIYNDSEAPVYVQTYLVSSQLCVWADAAFNVTKTQPLYWSIESGQPVGANSLPLLGPGCSDPDPYNPGGRATYGYLLVWAVDPVTLNEIRWNHLTGDALIVNYDEGSAWEYNALAFGAVSGAANGSPLLAPFGQLDFDGVEYRAAPDQLLLDFYASGSSLNVDPPVSLDIDTELTLWAMLKDLRFNTPPPGGSPSPQP